MTRNYFKTSSLVQLSCDCEGAFMGSFPKRSLLAMVTMAAIVIAGGCQMPPSPSANPPQPAPTPKGKAAVSQQLIIKFKPNTIVCDAAGIAGLSSATQVPLEHVRPMSGDACVVKQFADNAEAFSQGQEILKQHPAIEWLEEDRIMKAF